jgi:hypothetical protein
VTGEGAGAYVLQRGEGRLIDLGNFSMTVKASDAGTDGLLTVLEGEELIFIGDEQVRCPAGAFIFIPAESPHGFTVGDVPSRKLNLYLPAAMLGYFEDLSEAITSGTADDALLAEIAARNALEVIGPAPEGYL